MPIVDMKYDRRILEMDDTELEKFVRQWIGKKTSKYDDVKRFSGTGDLGRDVVGFISKQKHEGLLDNYQCKQFARSLPTDTGLLELGKILYYAYLGKFTAPNAYIFIAPRGINKNLESLIQNPSKLQQTLVSEWNKYCANKIIENQNVPLHTGLKSFLMAYDFSKVSRMTVSDMLLDG
ncbi:hypothetical protein [Herminiimonas contaminans]|uniref:Restriction endonuclease n=1 Tax=Herminiimonas contaminans TaxID=1111140 RepID=A0ABS0EY93_9BURK|nr:hypothetical protein [Herminiimonas contaminans]MBF8179704.1 hypothetical protein [Herminiimonas contaminans]